MFHRLMIVLILGLNIGADIDARHHLHNGFSIESFLTPQHAGLYGPWMAMAILMAIYVLRGRRFGLPRTGWLPEGYGISAVGVVLFGLGGLFDLFWHTTFGFEQFFDSTISPAHIWLVVAGGLMYLGVLRYSLVRHERKPAAPLEWPDGFSVVLGVALLLGLVMWLTFYLDPLVVDYASGGVHASQLEALRYLDFRGGTAQVAGVAGMLVVTAIIMSFVLTSLNRWLLPVGAITFMLTFYGIQKSFIADTYPYLPALLAAGIVGDAVWAWMRRGGGGSIESPLGYRAIAVAVPVTQFSVYFLIMAGWGGGILWPAHLWAGVIVMTGLAGMLLSYAIVWRRAGHREERWNG